MLVVTLRLHRSWTHWLQNRRVKQLVRQERRLRAMEELLEHQRYRVRKAEAKVHPLQIPRLVLPEDPPPPPMDQAHRVWQIPEPEAPPTEPPAPEDPPEELEPMPDPAQEIAQQIGLPLQRT